LKRLHKATSAKQTVSNAVLPVAHPADSSIIRGLLAHRPAAHGHTTIQEQGNIALVPEPSVLSSQTNSTAHVIQGPMSHGQTNHRHTTPNPNTNPPSNSNREGSINQGHIRDERHVTQGSSPHLNPNPAKQTTLRHIDGNTAHSSNQKQRSRPHPNAVHAISTINKSEPININLDANSHNDEDDKSNNICTNNNDNDIPNPQPALKGPPESQFTNFNIPFESFQKGNEEFLGRNFSSSKEDSLRKENSLGKGTLGSSLYSSQDSNYASYDLNKINSIDDKNNNERVIGNFGMWSGSSLYFSDIYNVNNVDNFEKGNNYDNSYDYDDGIYSDDPNSNPNGKDDYGYNKRNCPILNLNPHLSPSLDDFASNMNPNINNKSNPDPIRNPKPNPKKSKTFDNIAEERRNNFDSNRNSNDSDTNLSTVNNVYFEKLPSYPNKSNPNFNSSSSLNSNLKLNTYPYLSLNSSIYTNPYPTSNNVTDIPNPNLNFEFGLNNSLITGSNCDSNPNPQSNGDFEHSSRVLNYGNNQLNHVNNYDYGNDQNHGHNMLNHGKGVNSEQLGDDSDLTDVNYNWLLS
jgi:hypothetical protein